MLLSIRLGTSVLGVQLTTMLRFLRKLKSGQREIYLWYRSKGDNMSALESKAQKLAKVITKEAAKLGLIFVNGPDKTATTPVEPDPNTTNYQDRMGFHFAVAE
jgi:hypothetical protein